MNNNREDAIQLLVVDDEQSNLDLIELLLRKEPYSITSINNGLICIKIAETNPPDLILLDIMMPGIDGFGVIKKLKEKTHTKDIPIIILSALVDKENFVKGLKLGAVDYIAKPFNTNELIARIRTHTNLKLVTDKNIKLIKSLEDTRGKLEKAIYLKDELFSIITHDLKNPFQGILGLTEILSNNYDSLDDVERKDISCQINESSQEYYDLLDNLFNWINIQKGAIVIKKEEVNLNEIVEKIIQKNKTALENKKININFNPKNILEVLTDKNMITTSIRNLLSNAIKFSYKNSEINIELYQDGNNILISIEDYGIGINKNKMDHIFDIKKHISTEGTGGEKGHGIGLSLIKEFIEIINGKISYKSELSNYTKFIISLPSK